MDWKFIIFNENEILFDWTDKKHCLSFLRRQESIVILKIDTCLRRYDKIGIKSL